jgi:SAM-dependent MidA family methyltransferase
VQHGEDRGLSRLIRDEIAAAGGWLPFERYMALALYSPGRGYYSGGATVFGAMPASGSDFVTAPELSPHFGATLAVQVAELMDAAGVDELVEFGAGSGALAAQLLGALGDRLRRCTIVELSGALRSRQAARLAAFAPRVRWLDAWPADGEPPWQAVVVGNEVLDAMPVKLLHRAPDGWRERGVVAQGDGFAWSDRPTALRPPDEAQAMPAGSTVELAPQAEAFVRTLAAQLARGAALFVDYGFPRAELYHPQRQRGTLVCHRAHRVETDDDAPLREPGAKDITAHVDFSGVALAAQDAGLDVLGYTSQARFLLNCGLLDRLAAADLRERNAAHRLLAEHEMGELFKVLAFGRGLPAGFVPRGFAAGDRTHTL